jgi:hypothetical protein
MFSNDAKTTNSGGGDKRAIDAAYSQLLAGINQQIEQN